MHVQTLRTDKTASNLKASVVVKVVRRKEMVNFCGIVGCSNRSKRDKLSYFRLPSVPSKRYSQARRHLYKKRREKWLCPIRREDLGECKNLKNLRVCSDHFISGKLTI